MMVREVHSRSLRRPRLCILIALALTPLLGSLHLHAFEYSVSQTSQRTELTFHTRGIEARLLKSQLPSAKIILKLKGSPAELSERISGWRVPARSAAHGFRLIPYSKNSLLVIDLLDAIEYEYHKGSEHFTISLRDQEFRHEDTYAFAQARYHHRQGEVDEALRLYRRTLELNGEHGEAYLYKAEILLGRSAHGEAEMSYRRALENGITGTIIYRGLWQLYQATGEHRLARHFQNKYEQARRSARLRNQKSAPSNAEPADVEFVRNHTVKETTARDRLAAWSRDGAVLNYIKGIFGLLLFLSAAWMTWQHTKSTRPEQNAVGWDEGMEHPARHQIPRPRGDRVPEGLRATVPTKTNSAVRNNDHSIQLKSAYSGIDKELATPTKSERRKPQTEEPPKPETARPLDTRQLARRLNMGEAEVELALSFADYNPDIAASLTKTRVLDMAERKHAVRDIARNIGIGEGEVELLLRLASLSSADEQLVS